MPAFKPDKLRVNLKLCINRLKLLEKKKSELAINHVPLIFSEPGLIHKLMVTPY